MPVRHHVVLGLLQSDPVAQIEIDAAFEIVHRMPQLLHALLQRDAFGARELPVVGGPRRANAGAALRPIGDLRCREGEDIGIVVALDDLEVLTDEECRARWRRSEKTGSPRLRSAAPC